MLIVVDDVPSTIESEISKIPCGEQVSNCADEKAREQKRKKKIKK